MQHLKLWACTILLSSATIGQPPAAHAQSPAAHPQPPATHAQLPAATHSRLLDTIQLATITVTKKKFLFEQKPDRTIIDVQHSIVSSGSTVLQILQRSPGVLVDVQNGLISLNGKQGVTIMIDGKPDYAPMTSLLQLLGGMNSGNIASIELISTPPSGMDAEGAGGIINIVLKKSDRYGFNGNYSANLGYSQNLVTGASLNFNWRKKAANVYGDLSWSLLHTRQEFAIYHQTLNGEKINQTGTTAYRDVDRIVANGRLGIDWECSDKTELGLLVSASDNKFINHSLNKGLFLTTGQPDTLLWMTTHEINDWKSFSANGSLQHTFGKDTKLQFNANYLYYGDDQPTEYQLSFLDAGNSFLYASHIRSRKHTPIRFWVETIDLSLKPAKALTLHTGLKASYSTFDNAVEVDSLQGQQWQQDTKWSGNYTLKEFIPAGYLQLDYTLDKKTKFKGGLRYEYTHTTQTQSLTRHYGYLFPSIIIIRQPDETQTWSLTYNRRITRPNFTDMAQCVIFFDPWSLFAGNPALLPAIADNWQLGYSFKKLSLSLGYSFEKNTIANFFPTVDSGSNVETAIAQNLRDKRTFSADLTIPLEPAPWWSLTMSCTGLLQEVHLAYNQKTYRITQNSLHITATQYFHLGKLYTAELSGFYQSTSFFWGVYTMQPYGSLGAGIQRKFGPGRLRLSTENLLNTDLCRISIHIPEQDLSVTNRLRLSYPIFKLTWSGDFGNAGIKANRKHDTGAEEEQQRIQQ